jgi:hypothetical protein
MSKRSRRNIITVSDDTITDEEYAIDEDDYRVISEILRNMPESDHNPISMLTTNDIKRNDDERVTGLASLSHPPGPAIGKLDCLTAIGFRLSEDEELPTELGQLPKLTTCILDVVDRDGLPLDLCCLQKIEYLTIYSESLKALPPEIGDLKSLKGLLLPTSLERLPERFGELTALEELFIECENLMEIPETIKNLTKLESIIFTPRDCSNIQNRLYGLKAFLRHITVKRLETDVRLLMALPASFQMVSCANLEYLKLLIDEAFDGPIIDASKLINLKILTIMGLRNRSTNSLSCPPNLVHLDVQDLTISVATLESLPKRLKKLWLQDCNISQELSDNETTPTFFKLKLPSLEGLALTCKSFKWHLSGAYLPALVQMDIGWDNPFQYPFRLRSPMSIYSGNVLCLSGCFPNLRKITVECEDALPILVGNLSMPVLEVVKLTQNNYHHKKRNKLEPMAAFATRFLPSCPSLISLEMDSDSFERITPALVDVLPKNLENLMILSTPISRRVNITDFIHILPNVLSKCTQLAYLGEPDDITPVMKIIGRLLSMNVAKARILRQQHVSLGFWPTILANAQNLFYNKYKKRTALSGDFSREDALFRILQIRGQEIVTTAALVSEQVRNEKEAVAASKTLLLEDHDSNTFDTSFLTELMKLHDQLCEILSSKIVEVRVDGGHPSAKLYLLRNNQMKGTDSFKVETELYCALWLVCLLLRSATNNAGIMSSLLDKLSTTVRQCETLVKISKNILSAAGETSDHLFVWERHIEESQQKEHADDENSENVDILLDISIGQLAFEEQELMKMATAPTPDEMDEE